MLVNRDGNYFYDKPAIGVNTNWNFLGRVYVAFTKLVNIDANLSTLVIARSRDGRTFDPPIDVTNIVQDDVSGAQVVVDNYTGIIYVVYTNLRTRQLQMATVVDNASYPPQPLWVMKTENITPTRGIINEGDQYLNGGIRAFTNPSVRFYWPTGRICVAWHERATGGTDIFFTSKTPSDASWPAPVSITPGHAQDQFMPALDGDTNGNLVISFYDRYWDLNNKYYTNSYVVTDDTASSISTPQPMTQPPYAPRMFDPTVVPAAWGTDAFIGDYQDIWNWDFPSGNRYNSAWIQSGSTVAIDAWTTGIY